MSRPAEVKLLVAETRSGKVVFELPHTSRSWSQKINATGSASAVIQISDTLEAIYEQGSRAPGAVLSEILTGPFRYSIGLSYRGAAFWGGPLLPMNSVGSRTKVEIKASEFPFLLSKRKPVNRAGTGPLTDPSRDLIFERVNQRELAHRLVEHAVSGGTGYELPITCSAPPERTGIDSITYFAYDVSANNIRKALADIAKGEQGPDIRFDPYLEERSDGLYLLHDLKIGDPYLDGDSPVWTWDDSIVPLVRDADGVGMASLLYVSGDGQNRDKIVAQAVDTRLVDLGFPVLEDDAGDATSIKTATDAASAAQAALAASVSPTVTWSLKAPVDRTPQLGQYRCGELHRVDVHNHPLIDPGSYEQRVVALAGDTSDLVSITLGVEDDASAAA